MRDLLLHDSSMDMSHFRAFRHRNQPRIVQAKELRALAREVKRRGQVVKVLYSIDGQSGFHRVEIGDTLTPANGKG